MGGKKQNTYFKKPRNQWLLLIAIGGCFIAGTTWAMDDSAVVLERTKEEFRAIINEHLGQIKLGTKTALGNRFSVWKRHKDKAISLPQGFMEQILGKLTKEYIKNLTPAYRNKFDPIEDTREFWEGKIGHYVYGKASGKALFEFDLGRRFPQKWNYPDLSMNNPSREDSRRRLMEAKDVNSMSPSELVMHRRRLTHGTRVSPVLAALMEEIDEARRNSAARC